jgi:RNA recognition motif-containing protein
MSVLIPTDPKTGARKKYGYVNMTAEGCAAAIKALNGSVLNGHQLSVSPAERED